MSEIATTKMSSKGQVVIPEEIRRSLDLEPGSRFVVLGDDDVVILKKIEPLSMADFDLILSKARKQARQAAMKRSDVAAAVKAVRAGR